jgi:hypothetical protein
MSLVIRKKGNKNFFHYFTIGGTEFEYSASDLTIIIDNNKAKLRSITGRPIALKDGYTVNQITIFDDSTGGSAETFATFVLLTQRLIDLGYPAYYQDGQIILGDLISGDANNAIVLGSDGRLYVSPSSGGKQKYWFWTTANFSMGSSFAWYSFNTNFGINSPENVIAHFVTTPNGPADVFGLLLPTGYKINKVVLNIVNPLPNADYEVLVQKKSLNAIGDYANAVLSDFNFIELYRDFYLNNSTLPVFANGSGVFQRTFEMNTAGNINQSIDRDSQILFYMRPTESNSVAMPIKVGFEIEEI